MLGVLPCPGQTGSLSVQSNERFHSEHSGVELADCRADKETRQSRSTPVGQVCVETATHKTPFLMNLISHLCVI